MVALDGRTLAAPPFTTLVPPPPPSGSFAWWLLDPGGASSPSRCPAVHLSSNTGPGAQTQVLVLMHCAQTQALQLAHCVLAQVLDSALLEKTTNIVELRAPHFPGNNKKMGQNEDKLYEKAVLQSKESIKSEKMQVQSSTLGDLSEWG